MNSNLYNVPYLSQNSYLYGANPPFTSLPIKSSLSNPPPHSYKDELLNVNSPKPSQILSFPTFSQDFSWESSKIPHIPEHSQPMPEPIQKFPSTNYSVPRDENNKSVFLSKVKEQIHKQNEWPEKNSEDFVLPSFRSENSSIKFIDKKSEFQESLLEELENSSKFVLKEFNRPVAGNAYKAIKPKPRRTLDDMLEDLGQCTKKPDNFSSQYSEQSLRSKPSKKSQKLNLSSKKKEKPRNRRKNSSSSVQPKGSKSLCVSQERSSTEKEVFVEVMMKVIKDHAKNCKALRQQIDKVKFSKFFNV